MFFSYLLSLTFGLKLKNNTHRTNLFLVIKKRTRGIHLKSRIHVYIKYIYSCVLHFVAVTAQQTVIYWPKRLICWSNYR